MNASEVVMTVKRKSPICSRHSRAEIRKPAGGLTKSKLCGIARNDSAINTRSLEAERLESGCSCVSISSPYLNQLYYIPKTRRRHPRRQRWFRRCHALEALCRV